MIEVIFSTLLVLFLLSSVSFDEFSPLTFKNKEGESGNQIKIVLLLAHLMYSKTQSSIRPHFQTRISPSTGIKSRLRSNFGQIEYSILSYLPLSAEKFSQTYNGETVVSVIMSSFLIEFSSNLQITRTGIKSWRSSKSGKIGLTTVELPTIEC